MAAPAKGAWLLLLAVTLVCGILDKMHPFFSCAADLGVMLLLFYMLPFYPFDTFGGRRVREHNTLSYVALIALTIVALVLLGYGLLVSVSHLLAMEP